jgi:hypothetical protein
LFYIFACNGVGLRQDEHLSPLLCSIFLNDLKPFLIQKAHGLDFVKSVTEDFCFEDIEEYMYLFILLYADDTVILAETEKSMQQALDALHQYCIRNGVKANASETKFFFFYVAK